MTQDESNKGATWPAVTDAQFTKEDRRRRLKEAGVVVAFLVVGVLLTIGLIWLLEG